MDFGGINEPQKIKKIKKKTWPTAKNSTRFKSSNQIPFSLRRDLNSPVSIPSSIPFRSTRPRWQFGNKHARILARGSGSRRPNLRLKWKIGDGKIGRRHPSKQISFVPGKNSLSFSRMIRDRCVGVTRWGRKRTDFALLQGDPSLSSLSPVSKRGKNRALTVRWSRMDAWINRGCDWQVFGRKRAETLGHASFEARSRAQRMIIS